MQGRRVRAATGKAVVSVLRAECCSRAESLLGRPKQQQKDQKRGCRSSSWEWGFPLQVAACFSQNEKSWRISLLFCLALELTGKEVQVSVAGRKAGSNKQVAQ